MATLIAVYDSNGLVGRCDAKCYEAEHPECDCICGGANHGAGRDQAVANIRAMAQEMIDAYAERRGLQEYGAEVMPAVTQLELFNGHK